MADVSQDAGTMAPDAGFDSQVSAAPVAAPEVGKPFVDPTDGLTKMLTSTGETVPLHPELHKDIINAGASGSWPAPNQPAIGTIAPASEYGAGPVAAMPEQVPAAPAGLQKVSEKVVTKTEAPKYDAKLEKEAADKVKLYEDAIQASVANEKAKHDKETLAIESQNRQLADQNAAHQRRLDALESQKAAAMDDINKLSAKYGDMKVDPDLFGRMDTANKITASIGIMLGSLSQAFTNGKTNPAMDVLDKAIDRDIEAQKANIGKVGNHLQQSRGIYNEMLQATGDARAADAAARASIYDMVKGQLQYIASKSNSEQVQNNANTQIADLEMKKAAALNEAHKSVVSKVTEADRVASSGAKPLELVPIEIQKQVLDTESSIRSLDNVMKVAKNGKLGMGGRLSELKGMLGIQNANEAELESALIQTVADKTHKISGAGSTEKEVARLGSILGRLKDNPEAFFAKMDAEKKRLESDLAATRKAYAGVRQLPNPTHGPSEADQLKKWGAE